MEASYPAEWDDDQSPLEQRRVRLNRYMEARVAGLSPVEGRLFAESDADVGELRLLVAGDCPVELIRLIVL